MDLFLDVLAESLVDTAKMLPFLFLAYLFIEYVETRHGERIEALLAGGGRWGFVPGALLGCVPQCGFSAIASNFYASRVVTLGTLMAVFLATSDEAIPPAGVHARLLGQAGFADGAQSAVRHRRGLWAGFCPP